MALDIDQIKSKLGGCAFFTSDIALIEYLKGENVQPYSDYGLLVTEKDEFLIADSFEHVAAFLKQQNLKKVLFNVRTDAAYFYHFFLSEEIEIEDISIWYQQEMRTKTAAQINRIKQCAALNTAAYQKVKQDFCVGMSELEVLMLIKASYHEQTNDSIPMIFDLVAGTRTGSVSGLPTTYKVNEQDAMILDLLPRYKGMYADTTRTFFIGEVCQEKRRIYDLVRTALGEAEKLLKPGTVAQAVHECVNDVFAEAGLSQNFPHHAGHGFGAGIYEEPYFLPKEQDVLEENMVVTLEPGLYFPNQFGIRIENNYVITPDGCRRLEQIPSEIDYYILGGV